jgi:tRNA modification GTPase
VSARHRESLAAARASVAAARATAEGGLPADFVAIDLKAAIAAMGEVTGDAIAEEVIDDVFRRFCVGK